CREWLPFDVGAPYLEVRGAELVEEARVGVECHHRAARPDAVAQPLCDGAPARADVEASPPGLDAERFEFADRVRVEPRLDPREALALALPGRVERVARPHIASGRKSRDRTLRHPVIPAHSSRCRAIRAGCPPRGSHGPRRRRRGGARWPAATAAAPPTAAPRARSRAARGARRGSSRRASARTTCARYRMQHRA